MSVIVVQYKDFKDKIKLTKEHMGYRVEDVGNNVLMFTKIIELDGGM
ncbi:hypothetical protein SDC9_212508 [bioreactor metagenome]|uniref:Uncharacterized protein n=1 Tax=bioreactor metagenome TaxID=1076179 RepID=A0A645JM81_9ZZZZ